MSTTTDANGFYEFTNLFNQSTFFVVVNSSTLGEHFELNGQLNAGFSSEDVLGAQTYASEGALFDRGAGQEVHSGGALYGGLNVEQSDNLSGFQHIIRQTLSGDATDVDFGFSFNVVTNTRDEGDSQSIQGSLRQFINNANAIEGSNELRFVPVVEASETLSTGDIWRIDIEDALPTITDVGTSINGLAYNTDGNPISTDPVQVSSDTGRGSDGFGVVDADLGPSFRPLLELSGGGNPNIELVGLSATASQFQVSNLALINFSTAIEVDGENVVDTAIFDNFIGVRADDSTEVSRIQRIGVSVIGADDGRIEGNYIVNSQRAGILIDGVLGTNDQAENSLISDNYIVSRVGFGAFTTSDGIGLQGGTDGTTVINNRIENSREFGIDLFNNRGSVTIQNNTITGAGGGFGANGPVGGGIGLTSEGNEVLRNEIIDAMGTGVLVRGTAQFGGTDIVSATGNLISENYFEGNDGLDIDTTRPQDLPLSFGTLDINSGDGLDAIDGALDPERGSNGIDRPEISFVGFNNDTLTVEGSLLNSINDPQLELYLVNNTNNNSRLYLGTINVADQTTYDPATGNFSVTLVEPVDGWPEELTSGLTVAAIVIDGSTGDTSEFSQEIQLTPLIFSILENGTIVTEFLPNDFQGSPLSYTLPAVLTRRSSP